MSGQSASKPITPRSRSLADLFAQVVPTYEFINHVLTLGFDARWRRCAAREAARHGGSLWLDVCSGTGDMARALSVQARVLGSRVVAVDFCWPMLASAARRGTVGQAGYALAEADSLPFPGGTFDVVMISFATRNLNRDADSLKRFFKEFLRVLRPGGLFLNLETSQPRSFIIRKIFHGYVRALVKPVGTGLSGSRPAYAYLASTIPRFYEAERLTEVLQAAGFRPVRFRRLLFGAAAVHSACRPVWRDGRAQRG